MSTYVTVGDVRARFEEDIPAADEPKLQQKLDDAEVYLAREVGDLANLLAGGKVTDAELRIVLCNMVIRVLRNPSGIRSETAGPFSRTLDANVSSGKLFLTREDKALLGLRRGAVSAELVDESLWWVTRPSLLIERSNWSPEYFWDVP